MILAYIEKTPSELVGKYWEKDRLSREQIDYLEQLEQRGTEAFAVSSYSMF